METIPKNYDTNNIEKKWGQYWLDNKIFSHKSDTIDNNNCIMVIPPPNVTGKLHIGHALNNTYQDLIIRKNKMAGKTTIWVPGTDHAGIATQTKVEKILMKQYQDEGKIFTRQDIGREKFLEKIWEWKEKNGNSIIEQLKRLGCGCDWDRLQFTMDDNFSDLVKEMFVSLYNDKLIYQGEYIVNWCPVSQTALANEEVIYEDQKSLLYYVKYYIINDDNTISDEYLTIATTRPETIFGDTAVAYHPSDTRYNHLINKKVMVPIVNRQIPLIADHYPKPEFGTGLVKITPAHDPNDYKVGQRHKLEHLKILNEEAKIYNTNTKYDGMDRFEARFIFVQELKDKLLLVKEEEYENRIGKSYRSGAIVESLLSKQWFVKMKPLAQMVLEHEDEINFNPPHQKDIFRQWINNIQDWCISRQIWWGHKIPVWYGSDGSIYCDTKPPINTEIVTYTQDTNVLDTWFSSWLWTIGVFPDNEKEYRNQIEVLITGSDIMFFWVIRMMMASVYLTKQLPFKNVYLHGVIRDKFNEKMSKSKGNVIDPMEVIDEYSADAIRFSLVIKTPYGQDSPFSYNDVQIGRNFATKLWNTMRYIIDICQYSRYNFNNLGKNTPIEYVNYLNSQILLEYHKKDDEYDLLNYLDGFDKWILSELYETVKQVNYYYSKYNFSGMATAIYSFTWHKFCSIYLETTKYDKSKITKQFVLNNILNNIVRLIHPIMPHITEEIWYQLSFHTDTIYTPIVYNGYFPDVNESISEQDGINTMNLYCVNKSNDTDADTYVDKYMRLVKKIRGIKAEFQIPLSLLKEDGTKEPLYHGVITLNNIDSALACFIMDNKNYLIEDTKLKDINMEANTSLKYYQIDEPDMLVLYPVDSYFKFDNKIKIINKKIIKRNENICRTEKKLDTSISEKKQNKLGEELKMLHQDIYQLNTELKYYNDLIEAIKK